MPRKEIERVLNKLLVKLFGDILKIEEKSLQEGDFVDISVTEIHIIEAIDIDKERTMSEVANDLSITVGTLTTAINKLIKKGYVERKRVEEDRRLVLISLTEKGRLVFKHHEKFHDEMIKGAIEKMTIEEELVLISSLDKITKFFEDKYHLIKK